MRALPARRIATSALCATLLLGITGPVAVAADHGSTSDARPIAAQAPVPGADALLAQVKSLGDVGGVLKPVTDLLDAVLKADNGQLPAADAAKLADAVKDAIAKVTAAAPAAPVAPPVKTPAEPAVPSAPAVPNAPALPNAPAVPALPVAPPAVLPALPAAPGLPMPEAADRVAAQVPLDLKADALKALQGAVDSLVKAATSGDVAAVGAAATAVVTGLVNFVAAVVLGGGLPAPSLPGLPALPKLPAGGLPLPS
ncbi:hypothetical protein KUF83_23895 [Streptomyces sp. BV286]|uniref:hypothetical protein n=1 Tax=unclassified Streptomyces TaxID=2593676 RepID=UPI001C2E86C8|nr:hypothetical protein [Streptomyces sp. BV286]MBV1939580.1 hypothetical protein [Streptomyces sp. BV286]